MSGTCKAESQRALSVLGADTNSIKRQRNSQSFYITSQEISHSYIFISVYRNTMTSNIVLPPLSKWAQQHLTTIYQAVKSEDVNSAFDAFISQDVKITLNGKSITRDQYKQSIKGEKFAEASAQVNFVGTVEVPDDEDQPVLVRTLP